MCSVFFLYSLFIYYSLLFYLNSLPFTVSLIIVLLISDLEWFVCQKKKSGEKNLGENRLSRGASFPLAKERTVYDYDSDSSTGQKSDWIRTLRIFIQFCLVITPVSVHSWSIQAQVTVSISSQALLNQYNVYTNSENPVSLHIGNWWWHGIYEQCWG